MKEFGIILWQLRLGCPGWTNRTQSNYVLFLGNLKLSNPFICHVSGQVTILAITIFENWDSSPGLNLRKMKCQPLIQGRHAATPRFASIESDVSPKG
jgi:hypothetical protein